MNCQSDETTSIVVKYHYKNSEYIHYFSGIDKKDILYLCFMDIPNESIQVVFTYDFQLP